jgi:hypothetical protein
MQTELETINDHNGQTQAEFNLLAKGMSISDHTVLRCKRLTERVVGDTYSSWIALCQANNKGSHHKYVTWIISARPEGFLAEAGHYFLSNEIERSVGDYEARGGW